MNTAVWVQVDRTARQKAYIQRQTPWSDTWSVLLRGFPLMILRLCLRRSWYFCLHITCILVVMVLPVKSRRRQTKEQQDKQSEHNSTDNNCNQKEKATWGWGMQRKNTWEELTWKLEFGQNKWKVFTWPRTKKKQNNKKTIGRSENPNRQKSRWPVNTFSSKDDSKHTSNKDKRPGCNSGHGVY